MSTSFLYSQMINAREECVRRFGTVFSLPVTNNPLNNLFDFIAPSESGHMLDFGAGPQTLKSFISASFPHLVYHSFDTDPKRNCEWSNITDIPNNISFSLICANQVLEHIPVDSLLHTMSNLSNKLQPYGLFYATVPNIAHPNRFRGDIDHHSYISYNDLYYFCTSAGLKTLAIYRYSKRHPQGWIERIIAKKIEDIYRMDWADSICIIAQKG